MSTHFQIHGAYKVIAETRKEGRTHWTFFKILCKDFDGETEQTITLFHGDYLPTIDWDLTKANIKKDDPEKGE